MTRSSLYLRHERGNKRVSDSDSTEQGLACLVAALLLFWLIVTIVVRIGFVVNDDHLRLAAREVGVTGAWPFQPDA